MNIYHGYGVACKPGSALHASNNVGYFSNVDIPSVHLRNKTLINRYITENARHRILTSVSSEDTMIDLIAAHLLHVAHVGEVVYQPPLVLIVVLLLPLLSRQ